MKTQTPGESSVMTAMTMASMHERAHACLEDCSAPGASRCRVTEPHPILARVKLTWADLARQLQGMPAFPELLTYTSSF
jgi:hypothetical protein